VDTSVEGLLKRLKRTPEGKIDYLSWCDEFRLEHLAGLVSHCKDTKGPLSLAVPTPLELDAAKAMDARLFRLASKANALGVRLMVDAEQTYFQPAIDSYVYRLQATFNKQNQYTVFSTYQCYLRDTEERLSRDLLRAQRGRYNFG
jgi:proline dehydrogenase